MNFKHIFAIAASALPLAVGAQTIDFETTTWKQLGVYDTWEASPFRKGQLSGHVAVIDNPTKTQLNPLTGEPINPSEKAGRAALPLWVEHVWRTHRLGNAF